MNLEKEEVTWLAGNSHQQSGDGGEARISKSRTTYLTVRWSRPGEVLESSLQGLPLTQQVDGAVDA